MFDWFLVEEVLWSPYTNNLIWMTVSLCKAHPSVNSISHFVFIQEIQNKQKMGPSDETPRKGPESLPVGHHDIITDIATFQTTQGFIVTASRDGIVKVWK